MNALRAFAVFFVILHHWFPNFYFSRHLPLGEAGVILFFVLSGFLITEILIKYKLKAKANNLSKIKAFKIFFIRRSLRIFPIYYLTIFFFLLVYHGKGDISSNISYYLTYTPNILFYKMGHWSFGSHLWTLAVEEQFYLIWPFVIFFVPTDKLLIVAVSVIVLGVVSKFLLPVHPPLTAILTPHCFDSFGMGAVFAIVKTLHSTLLPRFKLYVKQLSLLFLVAAITVVVFNIPYNIVTERFVLSLLSLGIIVPAVFGFKGVVKTILENKILTYIGTISYGIYLYHNFIPQIIAAVINSLFGSQTAYSNYYVNTVTNFCFLFFVSICSWHLIEKPCNKLKENFSF